MQVSDELLQRDTTAAKASTYPFAALLKELRQRLAIDPFANPIQLLALDLNARVDRGEIGIDDLDDAVRRLTRDAFEERAERLGAYLGQTDPAANERAIEEIMERIAADGFETFRETVERAAFGIVFTAHPTFPITHELAVALAELATLQSRDGIALCDEARAQRLAVACALDHRPEENLTLDLEQTWSIEALNHAHHALDRARRAVLRVARRRWPDRWTSLSPRLISLASWVGYDQDGRTDLTWTGALAKRLADKQLALERYRAAIEAIDREPNSGFDSALQSVAARLALAVETVGSQLALLAAAERDPGATACFARAMADGREVSLVSVKPLLDMIEAALASAPADEARESLLVIRAGLRAQGLGLAHVHVRLNSSQLHNAVRRQIGLDTSPNDPANRRSYFAAINDLLDRARPATINFASLMEEWSSARRLMMTVAQIIKFVDSEAPVRFLIAETETGFTLLTALYYARIFDVEDRVEISPLFETAEAFERGETVLEEALRSPHYLDYIKRRGTLAVQFGYSDSGRFIGQMAATFRIERLRLRIAQLLEKRGLGEVEVILFNTHGESIGRGGHPRTLADRFRYVAPPVNRAQFHRRGIQVKEEISFQGGDGMLAFLTPAGALATIREILHVTFADDPEASDDPIYAAPAYAAEFFATIQQEFESLVDDPDYAALLGLFGTNLMYKAGSRASTRDKEGWSRQAAIEHPSQIRAVPNNAILQQLGFMANTFHGVGRAMEKDPEMFRVMRENSPRFRRALEMVATARNGSDLDVLHAYLDTINPQMWLRASSRVRSPMRAKAMRELARIAEHLRCYDRLARTMRLLQADHQRLAEAITSTNSAARERLVLLHAIRIAAIYRIAMLAADIPEFGPQQSITRHDVQARILALDVNPAVELLTRIFPRRESVGARAEDFGERATYRAEPQFSYAVDHAALFDPMLRLYDLARRIGTAITYELGALG